MSEKVPYILNITSSRYAGVVNRIEIHGSRPKTLALRFILLVLLALIFARIAPTLAEESSAPTPTPVESAVASDSPSESLSPTDSPSPSLSDSPSASSSETSSNSPSPSISQSLPPTALPNQGMVIHLPASLRADPRAQSISIPAISVEGPENLLVCINGSGVNIDLYRKDFVDKRLAIDELVTGDRTNNLLVTGTTSDVLALLNSAGGLRVLAPIGKVAGKSIDFSFIAVSEPTLEPTICSEALPGNVMTLNIKTLNIGLGIVKGTIPLKK